MPRPRASEPRHHLHVHIPESVILRVNAALQAGALGRRPRHGDMAALITRLLREWLATYEPGQLSQPFTLDDL